MIRPASRPSTPPTMPLRIGFGRAGGGWHRGRLVHLGRFVELPGGLELRGLLDQLVALRDQLGDLLALLVAELGGIGRGGRDVDGCRLLLEALPVSLVALACTLVAQQNRLFSDGVCDIRGALGASGLGRDRDQVRLGVLRCRDLVGEVVDRGLEAELVR